MREEMFAGGGCRCGAVGVTVYGEPRVVVYCHCEDCRRSSGAPVSVFAGYPAERLEVRGAPKVYDQKLYDFSMDRAFAVLEKLR